MRAGSLTFAARDAKMPTKISIILYQIAFLGKIKNAPVLYTKLITINLRLKTFLRRKLFFSIALKIITICFEKELTTEWPKILRTMRLLNKRNEASLYLWDFLEFVVTHRTPLYIQMLPFIVQKIGQAPISEHERNMQSIIREKINGDSTCVPKSRGALLADLIHDLKTLKEQIEDRKLGKLQK